MWNIIMLVPFSMISHWGYKQINTLNLRGLKPGFALDVLGVNLLAQTAYSFSAKGLYVFAIIPAYGVYKFGNFIWSMCCSRGGGMGGMMSAMMPGFNMGAGEQEPEKKSNRQLKKEQAEKSGKPT